MAMSYYSCFNHSCLLNRAFLTLVTLMELLIWKWKDNYLNGLMENTTLLVLALMTSDILAKLKSMAIFKVQQLPLPLVIGLMGKSAIMHV